MAASKQKILKLVTDYYQSVHAKQQNKKFIKGKSRVPYAGRVFDQNEIKSLVSTALDFWLTHGEKAEKFEARFAKLLELNYALLVNSGSSANLIAFSTLCSPLLKKRRILPGDEVITVAAGFPTTIAPIIQNRAIPVFLDVGLETANIDTLLLEKALSKKTKAVMIAHTLGNPFDLKTITGFCKKNDLWLIEDNCDALGSSYEGRLTGTFGDIATSSFYPPHHLTMGEGGAVYTNNPRLKRIAASLRDWGRDCWCASGKDNTCGRRFDWQLGSLPKGYDHKYIYSQFGYNLKLTDLQAAIGLEQLNKLKRFTKSRQKNHQYLYKGLLDFKDYFVLPEATENSQPSWFGFLLTVRNSAPFTKLELVQELESKNIQTRNLFAGNIIRQPLFNELKKGKDYRIVGKLENSDKIMNDSFILGVYPGLGKEQLDYVLEVIHDFVKSRRK